VACAAEDEACAHCLCETAGLIPRSGRAYKHALNETNLIRDLFLVFSGKVDEMIVLCSHQEWNCRLVEASPLTIPLFDAI
jgi:hypothetical protein